MSSDHDNATQQSLVDAVVGNLQEFLTTNGTFELEIRMRYAGAGSAGGIFTNSGGPMDSAGDGTTPQFNTEGHHVIALIADKDLQQNNPATHAKLMAILDAVPDGRRSLLEAATFPDDIRDEHPETKPWHFIDIPFKDGGPVTPPLPNAPHVLSKIEEFSTFLQGGGGDALTKADAVSWLIHLFGDVHQPLHCISHFSDLHPTGDRGGNSFKLRGRNRNLHSLWDSSVNITQSIPENTLADLILDQHKRDDLALDLAITDTEVWARTSFKLAKQNAYSLSENSHNPPTPSQAYLENMEKIGRRQAALAGYRLADRLVEVLP